MSQDEAAALAAMLLGRGIEAAVAQAVGRVPRHEFVPRELRHLAYRDEALPIGEGQTISQPYVVALMAEAARLSPTDRVLEVGAGSGYSAAVLSLLCREVVSVERNPTLAAQAAARLSALGFANVRVLEGDGSVGLREAAPFEAIVVTAGGPRLPEPLLWQLSWGGRLVMPVGSLADQRLLRVTRREGGFEREDLGGVRFVPLLGKAGWDEGQAAERGPFDV